MGDSSFKPGSKVGRRAIVLRLRTMSMGRPVAGFGYGIIHAAFFMF